LIQREFAGTERLYGSTAFAAFANAHVAVVGVGGVGSWAAEALARSGVGEISLYDLDHVAASNVNRQLHALQSTLGKAKVDAMRERLLDINPQLKIHSIDEFISSENAASLIAPSVQVIVDACDDSKAKVALAVLAKTRGIACVMSGAAGGKTEPWRIEQADLAHATHDKLLARVRTVLRNEHGFAKPTDKKIRPMGIDVVFSKEEVTFQDNCSPEAKLACAGYGSAVTVTSSFGMALAACALRALLGSRT
jgi:tRNA threonylcarbamoyladenosine dehydratase